MGIFKKIGIFLIALLMISISTNSFAVPYGFQGITSNSLNDVAIGEAQLSVDVTAVAGNAHQVLFTFTNAGPLASSITDVYFDDGTLLGIASISGSSGVSFSREQARRTFHQAIRLILGLKQQPDFWQILILRSSPME